ncbi:hypothetical protein BGX23_000938 [Mortierella sp. AD031]|nr:hypothetical protein BGX23_000938 [Mortierella sp. AD031]
MIRQVDRNAGGGGWFGSFFGKASRHRASDTEASPAATGDIALDSVRVHTPSINPEPAATQESVSLSEQEAAVDSAIDASAEGDEDDEEARCYHCREESSTGFLGRIVAVYKPGRPADRARDRPASSLVAVEEEMAQRMDNSR